MLIHTSHVDALGALVLSTDEYFERSGRYKREDNKLPFYHSLNIFRAEQAMKVNIFVFVYTGKKHEIFVFVYRRSRSR